MKTLNLTLRAWLFVCAALVCFAPLGWANGPAPKADQHQFEVAFMKGMIDHHYAAVKMSELCDGRTVHGDLLEMCHQMKSAQLTEISTMQGWLKSWYGAIYHPQLADDMRMEITSLSKLKGAAFEKAFMTMMTKHHAVALLRARDCLLEAYHPEMLNMCAMMLGDQGDEMASMRIWLRQWYQINDLP